MEENVFENVVCSISTMLFKPQYVWWILVMINYERCLITCHLLRDHFVYVSSQWETMLHSNVTSHWLGAYTKWSLFTVWCNIYITGPWEMGQHLCCAMTKHILVIESWALPDGISGIILCMRPANERRRYIVTSSLIGWAHTQNDPCKCQNAIMIIQYWFR